MYYETKSRSIIKTISWRILATLTTIILVYIFIGDVSVALSVGGIEVFLKMLVYFLHERMWSRIKFGKKQINPSVIWLTGLAKSGKKAIGTELEELLKLKGFKTEYIDGHSVRGMLQDYVFEKADVNNHIARVGVFASRMEKHGIFVIASFLSPYEESRNKVRSLCKNFQEVYVNTPVEICEKRDDTGIYIKAKKGEIKNFPGIDIPYEEPKRPEVTVNISEMTSKEAAKRIFEHVSKTF